LGWSPLRKGRLASTFSEDLTQSRDPHYEANSSCNKLQYIKTNFPKKNTMKTLVEKERYSRFNKMIQNAVRIAGVSSHLNSSTFALFRNFLGTGDDPEGKGSSVIVEEKRRI